MTFRSAEEALFAIRDLNTEAARRALHAGDPEPARAVVARGRVLLRWVRARLSAEEPSPETSALWQEIQAIDIPDLRELQAEVRLTPGAAQPIVERLSSATTQAGPIRTWVAAASALRIPIRALHRARARAGHRGPALFENAEELRDWFRGLERPVPEEPEPERRARRARGPGNGDAAVDWSKVKV